MTTEKEIIINRCVDDTFENEQYSKEFIKSCVYAHYEKEFSEDINNITEDEEEKIARYVEDIFENEYDSKEFIRACVYEYYEGEKK